MKIKVKRVRGGSMGDQRDYGLVTGSIWNYEDKPSTNTVSTTMSPTSREDATIEAERGETVVGDLDNDGQLEHAKIGGKRHAQGGTPLNVPDGSFVFSDFRGLLIKNKELLSNVFNYKSGKSATPAKVASRYELNRYKDLLNDPNADFLDQKTAQLMIDNNLKKLGQLALVQESMKGFPDGIPNIALPLFGSDMQAGGSMPQMRRGGLVKAQGGKNVALQYWNKKFKGKMPSRVPANSGKIYYDEDNEERYDFTPPPPPTMVDDFLLAAGSPFATLMSTGIRSGDWRDYVQENRGNPIDVGLNALAAGYAINPGFFVKAPSVVSRVGAATHDWFANPYPYLFNRDFKEYGGQHMEEGGEEGEEPGFFDRMNLAVPALTGLGAAGVFAAYPWLKTNVIDPAVSGVKYAIKHPVKVRAGKYPSGRPKYKTVYKGIVPTVSKAYQAIPKRGRQAGLIGLIGSGVGLAADYFLNEPEGEVVPENALIPGSYDQSTVATPVTTLDQVVQDEFETNANPNQAVVKQSSPKKLPASGPAKRQPVPQRRNVGTVLDSSVLKNMSLQFGGYTHPMFQSAGQFSAYQEPSRITSNDQYEVVAPSQTFPYRFGVQSFDPKTGTYTIADPSGKNIALDLSDLYSRIDITEKETGLPIISNYDKGIDQWKKDITSSDVATRKKAVGHAQRAYNEARTKLGLSPYFYGKPGSDPYGIDEMLGLYTFSMPGLRKKKKQEPTPASPVAQTQTKDEELNYTGPGFQAATRPRSVGFSPQDIAGMIGVAGQQIPDYMLTTARMDPSLISPAYTEFDPSATMGAYEAFLQNVGTGPSGRGATLSASGAAGKTFEALNRERQANRASNLDTFLRTAAANQQALNQANLYNTEEQKAYIDRMNILEEADVAARNKKLADFTERYATGLTNIGKLNAVNAMMPYQYSDWLTTTVNPTLRSIYDEPITGASSGAGYDTIYNSIYNQLISAGVPTQEAAVQATQAAARMATSRGRGGYGTSGSASSIYDFMT